MNVIILGAGEVGIHLGTELSEAGHNIIVVDNNRSQLQRLEDICDAQTICGNAADLLVLKKAGIEECNLLLAATSNDEVNVLSCLLAKNLTTLKTVARLKQDFYLQGFKTFYRHKLGIDMIVCPEILAALDIVGYTGESETTAVETLADGQIEVKTIKIDEHFKYHNTQIDNIPFPKDVLVSTIVRDQHLIIPHGKDKILLGDELYIVGQPSAIGNVDKLVNTQTSSWFFSRNKTAFVLGGGRIGALVAQKLAARKIDVKLIDESAQKCEQLAKELTNMRVFCADGTDPQFLHEEGIEDADYFIATCKNDETNVLASLLARDMGIGKVITVVNRMGYDKVLAHLGLKHLVNPRYNTSKNILEFIANGNMLPHLLSRFQDASLLEIYTDDHFSLHGKRLDEIQLPAKSLICSILRDEKIFVPRGDTILKAHDIVVLFTMNVNLTTIKGMFLPS